VEWRRAAAGDEPAFESLVRRHQDRVFTRIFFMVRDRETAADLTQEALLRAWRGLPRFRGESLFSTWLARVAVNVTRHHFEKVGARKRRGKEISIHAPLAHEGGREIEIPDRTHLPDEWAVRNEHQRRILAAVGELEPEFRMALALRELHGYSYQEIGAELDLPIGTVKSKIFRARQQLQEKLRDLL
jgi:RNA polymerase sigma-70 factor (ECF subfamily)